MAKKYRIKYDKWFSMSKPVIAEINGKKCAIDGASIMIEYKTLDERGAELFYESENEKPYEIDDERLYENDFVTASIGNDGVVIEENGLMALLKAMFRRTLEWRVSEWYLDAVDTITVDDDNNSYLKPILNLINEDTDCDDNCDDNCDDDCDDDCDEEDDVPVLVPIQVTEEFFHDFIKTHIEEFKNDDNIDAQSSSVGWNEVNQSDTEQ